MREKRLLYFVLGVMAVVSTGAVTNQIAPLAPASGVALGDTGIRFPDGTEQTTAATDAGSAARNSFSASCRAFTIGGGGSCRFPAVPAGKIMVVEFVSADVVFAESTIPGTLGGVELWVEYALGGSDQVHTLVHHYQYKDSAEYDRYKTSQPIRLYVDQQTTLTAVINDTVDHLNGTFWITGHYVDMVP